MAISALERAIGPAPEPGRRLLCALTGEIQDFDVARTLHFTEGLTAAKRRLEVEALRVGLHYADLHAADPRESDPDPLPGRQQAGAAGRGGHPDGAGPAVV